MPQPPTDTYSLTLRQAIDELQVAIPMPGSALGQDEEWVVVKIGDTWQKIRLHDYGDVYSVPGLYEKWVYDMFQCRSPQMVADLLMPAAREAGVAPEQLTVLDLGAGNGYVADVLRGHGVQQFVGVDIFKEAATAAERDRPGMYADYVIDDMTDLSPAHRKLLDGYAFNCLTCVAALGFGDIPPEVFAAAYNYINNDGWIAFTINTNFTIAEDRSGFAALIKRMLDEGVMSTDKRETFVHRVSNDGKKIEYDAFIGRKHRDIPADWL